MSLIERKLRVCFTVMIAIHHYQWVIINADNNSISILLLSGHHCYGATTWSNPLNSHIIDVGDGSRGITRCRDRKIRLFVKLTIWRASRDIQSDPRQRTIIRKNCHDNTIVRDTNGGITGVPWIMQYIIKSIIYHRSSDAARTD